jgi:quercetin dioxygenase-like cupin family protein
MTMRLCAGNALAIVTWSLVAFVVSEEALAQGCKPVSERAGDQSGCWILADEKLGQLPQKPLFWHLANYPTRAEAEFAKGPRGTVIDAFQKIWLSTIAEGGDQTRGGTDVAQIGPLPGISSEQYTAHYMEAVSAPGNTSRNAHRHDGPEAWYTLTGEVCLETPDGMKIGRAGESAIAPPGHPMIATTVGTELRRSLVLVLHETAKPWVTPVPDWMPKGLCDP